jgi:ParB-like chromosome segregation protein Spo0J
MPQVKIDDLTPYEGNARRGKIDTIVESLQINGQYRPIVVNKGTHTGRRNEILAGNHTWQAAAKLGWDKIDVHWVDVDDAAARRINLVDNRANDIAGYDEAELAALLKACEGDLAGTGYTEADLEKMFNDAVGDDDGDADPGMGDLEYRIVVDCRDEDHQADLLARFDAEGLVCRPLIS